MTPEESKAPLRARMRSLLRELPPGDRLAAGAALAERVLTLPELASPRGILACLSFAVEPDTWGLVEELQREGHRLFVPRARAADKGLSVHPWPCRLETLSFGLEQPSPGEPELAPDELSDAVEVVLVLGLAFDRQGYRLGHGGGYFDRFLRPPSPLAIGLAFDEQILAEVPRLPHDLPMDLVVTPSRVLRPAGGA